MGECMVLTVKDVSEILGIGLVQAYKLVKRSDFPTKRIGRRIIIPRDRFIAWLNNAEDTDSIKEEE